MLAKAYGKIVSNVSLSIYRKRMASSQAAEQLLGVSMLDRGLVAKGLSVTRLTLNVVGALRNYPVGHGVPGATQERSSLNDESDARPKRKNQ
jgi:hypothetical protein